MFAGLGRQYPMHGQKSKPSQMTSSIPATQVVPSEGLHSCIECGANSENLYDYVAHLKYTHDLRMTIQRFVLSHLLRIVWQAILSRERALLQCWAPGPGFRCVAAVAPKDWSSDWPMSEGHSVTKACNFSVFCPCDFAEF